MLHTSSSSLSRSAWFAALLVLTTALAAQDRPSAVLRVEPPELTLPVGAEITLRAQVVDAGGRPIDARVMFLSSDRRALRVDRDGTVHAIQPGRFEVTARSVIGDVRGPETVVPVTVPFPTATSISIEMPDKLWVGCPVDVRARVLDENGGERTDLKATVAVTNPAYGILNAFGQLTGLRPGPLTLRAQQGDLVVEHALHVLPNPVAGLRLEVDRQVIRTGDVLRFDAIRIDAAGRDVDVEVPVQFSLRSRPDDALGNGATGQIRADGRFVAETPGLYTVIATCGRSMAKHTIRAEERFRANPRQLVKVGHGPVGDVHTSDLWVWEGADGRDYAVTGTWGADGDAIFWDVTDPAKIERISTVRIDARTVNDVKVSADGKLCVLSREGASNRKNGIVLIDVEDPRNPRIVSTYDDQLTGGVHNVYIDQGFIYALSAARRYDVIDIHDPGAPVRVSSFQLFEPGASIHDVWVSDGIAFSSNWRYGLRLVDVGNGIAGGSPQNPVEFANYAYPSGWNHAAFPWKSPDTGRFYVVAGDEAFPYGLSVKDNPTYPRGWIHFVDFTDFAQPDEVARYQVPEAGTHNMWIEGTMMYVAYYNAGLRVVDISGELMGDLYRQGREIAWFLPTDPNGMVPNAPMTWGPQPHKGHIFFSDWNSGLWAVKLVPGGKGRL